mmetsp:Transcript_119956/g.344780  ORF Transcript_119956/g.344780 Transcript_119956/m.344780 type:complete len:256 (-) Transcript_119956:63-830(-)
MRRSPGPHVPGPRAPNPCGAQNVRQGGSGGSCARRPAFEKLARGGPRRPRTSNPRPASHTFLRSPSPREGLLALSATSAAMRPPQPAGRRNRNPGDAQPHPNPRRHSGRLRRHRRGRRYNLGPHRRRPGSARGAKPRNARRPRGSQQHGALRRRRWAPPVRSQDGGSGRRRAPPLWEPQPRGRGCVGAKGLPRPRASTLRPAPTTRKGVTARRAAGCSRKRTGRARGWPASQSASKKWTAAGASRMPRGIRGCSR